MEHAQGREICNLREAIQSNARRPGDFTETGSVKLERGAVGLQFRQRPPLAAPPHPVAASGRANSKPPCGWWCLEARRPGTVKRRRPGAGLGEPGDELGHLTEERDCELVFRKPVILGNSWDNHNYDVNFI